MAREKKQIETVGTYVAGLAPDLGVLVEAIRRIILEASPEVGEEIKWNSPSFFFLGEMQPFNPKEYKRDIVVMNLSRGYPLLVFPTGAKIPDTSGILEGDYKDGRRMITIRSLEEVETKAAGLQGVIRSWIAMVER